MDMDMSISSSSDLAGNHRILSADELAELFKSGATPQACHELAFTLSHVVGPDEQAMVVGLHRTDVVSKAVTLVRQPDAELAVHHSVLGALVNLACIGGGTTVKQQGGFDLMLAQLHSKTLSVVYYAVAGVQNMVADLECLQRVVDTDSDVILEQLFDHENEAIRRFATGALANICEVETPRNLATATFARWRRPEP